MQRPLTATPSGTDPQGCRLPTPTSGSERVNINGATAATLNLSTITVAANDQLTVEVTPNNGVVSGTPFTSTALTVLLDKSDQVLGALVRPYVGWSGAAGLGTRARCAVRAGVSSLWVL